MVLTKPIRIIGAEPFVAVDTQGKVPAINQVGDIVDIRAYDHAQSVSEIEEISDEGPCPYQMCDIDIVFGKDGFVQSNAWKEDLALEIRRWAGP